MSMTKRQKAEQEAAIQRLRELLKPGDTVWTTVKHVSRSGMSREISAYVICDGAPVWISGSVAAATGLRRGKRDGVVIGGGGMDMCFALVYELSHVLWPNGFGCVGEENVGERNHRRCPSNDHANGDRDYTPHQGVKLGPDCGEDAENGPRPCTCHDASTWAMPDNRKSAAFCSGCGCERKPHWHRNGGYALRKGDL